MRFKGRVVKDDFAMVDRGNGVTEIVPADRFEPIGLQYFQWEKAKAPEEEKEKPVRKNKTWVIASVIAAAFIGGGSVFTMFFHPAVATPVMLACLGWLGFVAFANK